MVLRQTEHKFVVLYTPPEGDLLSDAERADLNRDEGKLVVAFMEVAARKMIARFRRKFTKVLAGLAVAGAPANFDARIVDGAVEVVVRCAPSDGVVESSDVFTDAVVKTWERAANRPRVD